MLLLVGKNLATMSNRLGRYFCPWLGSYSSRHVLSDMHSHPDGATLPVPENANIGREKASDRPAAPPRR